ncbi:acyltransferase family protein [Oryzifoliimicrobium ureilyticus]|uniref:acyltransferase family protein n=1 Tax=Oryzifoliimicrobium ureilyticus TaxID=3113724 RepID=UPI0030765059
MDNNIAKTPKEFFLCLEGIRGIAAIVVATRHIDYFNPVKTPMSFLAVDLFFVLSGFVIAYNYESKLRSGATSFASFIFSRLVRIYPLYILGSSIGLTCILLQNSSNLAGLSKDFGLALFFLPDLAKLPIYPFNHPAWSLFSELAFSFIYAGLLVQRRSAIIAVTALISFVGFSYAVVSNGSADVGYQPSFFLFGLLRISCSFSIGVLIFRHRHYLEAKLRMPRIGAGTGTLLIYCVTFIALALPLPRRLVGLTIAYDLFVVAVVFPILVVLALQCKPIGKAGSVSKLLGKISFPLYAVHAPLVIVCDLVFGSEALMKLAPASGFLMLLAFIGISIALEKYFDAPIQRRRRRKLIAPLPPETVISSA